MDIFWNHTIYANLLLFMNIMIYENPRFMQCRVGCVCCCFSPELLIEFFFLGSPIFHPLQKPTFPNPNSI